VKMLADTAWRQIRVSVFEADLMVFSPTAFDEFEMQHKALANLSLHGQRLARQFERTMKELHNLQKVRKANEKTESGFVFTEAPSPAKIEPISTPSGFVFTTAASANADTITQPLQTVDNAEICPRETPAL